MSGTRTRRVVLPDPHDYDEDPKAKVCRRCPLARGHEVHSEAAIAAAAAKRAGWLAEEARRQGERA